METIHIYHTNDIHSHFEHWPRIASFISARKLLHEQSNEDVFVFDIGDHLDRWHPFSDGTRGKGNCELLNAAGYTAATIGNNEGITLSAEDLDHMYDNAEFSVLVANLYQPASTRPRWAKPFKLFETISGIKVAVIGLTVNFSSFYNPLGWEIRDPIEELSDQLSQINGKADIVILLSHLGIHKDEQIAEQFPDIDVILGGHTHHILHQGREAGKCLLAAAGKFGMYAGYVSIKVDPVRKEIINKRANLYDANQLPPVENEEQIIRDLYENGKALLDTQVTVLPDILKSELFQETPLAELLCSALREWCEADCAFINTGLLLKDLPKGGVTEYDLLTACPHPINPCVIELTGTALRNLLIQTQNKDWPHMQIKGFGFRGTVMGIIVFDGIEITMKNGECFIEINRRPIDFDRVYKLAIPDMFTFGRFFPEVAHIPKKYYLPEFLRDLLKWKLQRRNN